MTTSQYRWGFAFFDFASSAYILVFNAFLFPIFFRESVFANSPAADFYWGLTVSISLAAGLLVSPLVGQLADRIDRRRVLLSFVLLTIVGLITLCGVESLSPAAFSAIFGLTNLSYVVSLTIYDSFLVFVADEKSRPQVSGFAWGFGYLGGVLCLILIRGLTGEMSASTTALSVAAGFYAVFSLLSVLLLPKIAGNPNQPSIVRVGRAVLTGGLVYLLVSFLLINEGIDIVIYFTSLYGRVTLGLSTETIGTYLLVVQLLAFPGTWWVGRIAARLGEKRVILATLWIWSALIIGTALARTSLHLFSLAAGLALVIGSSQAMMRSYFSRQFSSEYAGFSFGVYSLISRATSLFGAAIFGAISVGTGSQRVAMIAILPFFILGGVLLHRISKRPGIAAGGRPNSLDNA